MASKRVPKGVQRRPKTIKKRGCISKPFSDVSGMTARTFYLPFWVHFGSQNRLFFMLFFVFFFGCIFGGLWLHFWCHFVWFLDVFFATFPDFVKNGAPHESAVNSDWIEGRAPRKTIKKPSKTEEKRQKNEDGK